MTHPEPTSDYGRRFTPQIQTQLLSKRAAPSIFPITYHSEQDHGGASLYFQRIQNIFACFSKSASHVENCLTWMPQCFPRVLDMTEDLEHFIAVWTLSDVNFYCHLLTPPADTETISSVQHSDEANTNCHPIPAHVLKFFAAIT